MKTPNKPPQVSRNQPGWLAILHKDGWWVGDNNGVFCYSDPEVAKAALTIIWQRDGGKRLNFRIQPFPGGNVRKSGDYTPAKTIEQAIKDYENHI